MTDDDLVQEINRSQEAAQLLDNPLMILFFEEAEKELWQAFKSSGVRDQESLEKIRLMQFWLSKFQQVMADHVMSGKMASMELNERRTLARQLKDAIQSANPWS